jgi:P27 family predicted phage terminase small subunit
LREAAAAGRLARPGAIKEGFPAMRGPPPTPTHLRLLRGNPGKRPLKPEPQPEQIPDVPDPPAFLVGFAADEWSVVCEQLQRLHLLTKVDLPSLMAYCWSYQTWRTAAEALAKMAANDSVMSGLVVKSKDGAAAQNPLVAIARKAAGDMVRYAGEFGLSPIARARLGNAGWTPPPAPGKFDGFLA